MRFLKKLSFTPPLPLKILVVLVTGGLLCGFSMPPEWIALLVVLALFYFVISFFSSAVGLAIIAVAMLFSPEFSLGAIGQRSVAVRLEDLLIPVLVLAWLAQLSRRPNSKLIVRSPVNKPISILLLLSAISSAWGVAFGTTTPLLATFYQLKVLEYIILFYLVMSYIQNEKQIKVFLFFALITVLMLAIFTLMQVPNTEIFTEHRITTPFEGRPEPSTAGGYLAFSFLLVFSLMIYQKSGAKRILLGVLSAMILIPLVYTYSRTSYMMLVGGMIVLALLSKVKWLKVMLGVLFVLSPVILPATVKDRIAFTWLDAKNVGREIGVDYSSQERIYSAKRAWSAVKRNPILGLGIASWEYPDNQYTRTVHEIGFIGLFLWLAIYMRLFRMGQWLYEYCPGGTFKGLALGYSAGVIGILIHGFGSCTFYVVRIMEPFWFISGLVAALYNLKLAEFYAAPPAAEVTQVAQEG